MKLRYRLLWLVAIIAAFMLWRRPHVSQNELSTEDSKGASDTTVVVQMLHSGESSAWLEEAARLFKSHHPEIVLEFTIMGSTEAIEAIAEHRVDPLVWSPSDSIDLSLLKSRMRSTSRAKVAALKASAMSAEEIAKANAAAAEDPSAGIFSTEGAGSPQPMLLSPLVWLGWERQTGGLQRLQQERLPQQADLLSWSVVYEVLTGNLGWSAPPSGTLSHALHPLRIGYADPRRSSSGIQALYLLTLEFFGSPRSPSVVQVNDPRYRELIKEINAEAINSGLTSGRLLEDMLRYGPSKFDLILTYESLALNAIKSFPEGRWGKLKIYYPTYTVWNDHPVVQMATKPWNEEEMQAAREWITFLRSKEMQEKALAFGFRPSDPNIPLQGGPGSPLEALMAAGLRLDVPTAAVSNEQRLPALLDLWTQEASSGEVLEVSGPWSGTGLAPAGRAVAEPSPMR